MVRDAELGKADLPYPLVMRPGFTYLTVNQFIGWDSDKLPGPFQCRRDSSPL
jgi:hypothetical protein